MLLLTIQIQLYTIINYNNDVFCEYIEKGCFMIGYCSGRDWNNRFRSLVSLALIDRSFINGLTCSVILWRVWMPTLTSSHKDEWILIDLFMKFSIIYMY